MYSLFGEVTSVNLKFVKKNDAGAQTLLQPRKYTRNWKQKPLCKDLATCRRALSARGSDGNFDWLRLKLLPLLNDASERVTMRPSDKINTRSDCHSKQIARPRGQVHRLQRSKETRVKLLQANGRCLSATTTRLARPLARGEQSLSDSSGPGKLRSSRWMGINALRGSGTEYIQPRHKIAEPCFLASLTGYHAFPVGG